MSYVISRIRSNGTASSGTDSKQVRRAQRNGNPVRRPRACHASGSGAPGSVVSYEVTITNTGDGSDTFDLTVSGYAWATTISDNSVTLGAGESAVVTVEVTIPGDAADGDMDTVTVTATSSGDPGVSDSHDITTTASTAPPNFPTYLPIMLKP